MDPRYPFASSPRLGRKVTNIRENLLRSCLPAALVTLAMACSSTGSPGAPETGVADTQSGEVALPPPIEVPPEALGTAAQPWQAPAGINPYASEVIAFEPGPNAGFGLDNMPDIVLGPPLDLEGGGATDVLSLGRGGVITLGFGNRVITDGPGVDLVIFENPFWIGGNPRMPFAELAEVSVSADGETWHTFNCEQQETAPGQYHGCAGWSVLKDFEPDAVIPLDSAMSGGDTFDLAVLGVDTVRFVRIRDISESGASPSAGFDLDAVGGVYMSQQ